MASYVSPAKKQWLFYFFRSKLSKIQPSYLVQSKMPASSILPVEQAIQCEADVLNTNATLLMREIAPSEGSYMSGACVWMREKKERFFENETARRRRNVKILFQLGLISATMGFSAEHSVENQASTGPLILSISCRNNVACLFRDEEIVIDIVKKNNTDHDIGFPLDYLRRKGMYCLLTDNVTRSNTEMGTSLTPPAIRRQFVKMKAGAELVLSHRISADLIRSIGGGDVDITASIEISGLLELKEGTVPVKFTEIRQVTIRS